MVDKKRIEAAVKQILIAIGEDENREGLKDTPERVARMYDELTAGYDDDASVHLSRTFAETRGELVLEKDIAFSSMCEHHLMPFFGKVHIAYIPNGKVVGLSKLARVVEVYCRRLQLQERMNAEIADAIWQELSPKGVFVVVEAEHTCMTARGIKKVGSKTVTMAVRGEFSEELKNQVLALVK
ncbi:MAG: GTP cyclohydrolase I FolE [Clostridia bacterium]|nr:GTP cyclohydrolase I FolE [Clostridia bacterium]